MENLPPKETDGAEYRCKATLVPGPSKETRLPRPKVGQIMGLFRGVKAEFPPRRALAAGNETPPANGASLNAPDLLNNSLKLSFW